MPKGKQHGPWAPNPSVRKALSKYYSKCFDRYGDKEYCSRVAWTIYCSYKNPEYKGCTKRGKRWIRRKKMKEGTEEFSLDEYLLSEVTDDEIFEMGETNDSTPSYDDIVDFLENDVEASSYIDSNGYRHWIVPDRKTGELVDVVEWEIEEDPESIVVIFDAFQSREMSVAEAKDLTPKKALKEYPVKIKLPKGVRVLQRVGKDYWYVKRGAVTLGVVSPDNEGGFDADLSPSGGSKDEYREGFDSVESAVTWILAKEGLL